MLTLQNTLESLPDLIPSYLNSIIVRVPPKLISKRFWESSFLKKLTRFGNGWSNERTSLKNFPECVKCFKRNYLKLFPPSKMQCNCCLLSRLKSKMQFRISRTFPSDIRSPVMALIWTLYLLKKWNNFLSMNMFVNHCLSQ